MVLLFKKYIFILKTCFVAAVPTLFYAVPASAQMISDTFNTKSGTIIMFQKFDKKYYETLEYLKFADRLISSCLNSSAIKKSYTCQIFVLSDKVKNDINIVESSSNINIYLHKDFRQAKNKFIIVTRMINAMLLGKAGFNPNTCKYPLSQWLLIGIYARLESRFFSHSILPVSYFPGLKALCQADQLPDFVNSLNTVLLPEKDGTGYQLYQELCSFTLDEIKDISSRTDNPITDLIFLTARNKYSANEIFDYTVGRAIIKNYDKLNARHSGKSHPATKNDAQKIQNWFKLICNKRLINVNSPLPTGFFVERFNRFRKFTCIYKMKDGSSKSAAKDISRVTEFYDEYEMSVGFREMLDKKYNELNALIYVSQPLCSPSLEKLKSTLQQFDNLPTVIIKKRLTEILAEISRILERQQKIENYLKKIEYTTVAPGKLYRNELLEDKQLRKNFCPAINNYLDEVEKKFLKD